MTFEEKYTILAAHHIQGFLADRIPYIEDGRINILDDYNKILHIHNPAHEEFIKYEYLNNNSVQWFVPEEIAPIIITRPGTVKEDIKNWTTNNLNRNFHKWLFPERLNLMREDIQVDDKWFILSSFLALPDPNKIGRAWLKTTGLILDYDNLSKIKRLLSTESVNLKIDIDRLKAGIRGNTYNSILDLIWRDTIIEYNSETSLIDDYDSLKTWPMVTEVSENSSVTGDSYFDIPSKKIRGLLNISSTDKTGFYDDNLQIKVIRHSTKRNTYESQEMLLADRKSIVDSLRTNNLTPIWICQEFRSTMDHPIIKENDAHWQNCRTWIVIQENRKCKSFLIHNDYYK